MLQWIGVALTILGLAYTTFKDVQTGNVKIWPENKPLTEEILPVQFCYMMYDPNTDRVWYQHENGAWLLYPPEQKKRDYYERRRYSTETQVRPQNQGQGQTYLGTAAWASGAAGYPYRQQAQTPSYPQGY